MKVSGALKPGAGATLPQPELPEHIRKFLRFGGTLGAQTGGLFGGAIGGS
jgi:hypothetical protein